MSPPELQIVEFLRRDWASGFRITTIEQAMRALGLSRDDELRWRVGQELDDEWRKRMTWRKLFGGLRWLKGFRWLWSLFRFVRLPSLLAEVKEWNPASYILTNDEKLIARHILRTQRDGDNLPSVAEISLALNLDAAQTHAALQMLARIDFIALGADAAYSFADDYERLLRGLGFSFHTVTLENGEQFNVP